MGKWFSNVLFFRRVVLIIESDFTHSSSILMKQAQAFTFSVVFRILSESILLGMHGIQNEKY